MPEFPELNPESEKQHYIKALNDLGELVPEYDTGSKSHESKYWMSKEISKAEAKDITRTNKQRLFAHAQDAAGLLGLKVERKDDTYGDLQLSIEEGYKFIGVLKSLSPDDISESVYHSLSEVLYKFKHGLDLEYDISTPGDRVIELLGNMSAISNELTRLGLDKKKTYPREDGGAISSESIKYHLDELNGYKRNADRKTLKEYHELKKLNLLATSQLTIGDAYLTGHQKSLGRIYEMFSIPYFYEERLEQKLRAIEKSLENKNAAPLSREAIDQAISQLEVDIKSLGISPEQITGQLSNHLPDETRDEVIEDIPTLLPKLRGVTKFYFETFKELRRQMK